MSGPSEGPSDVGSVSEEALKLLGVLQGWARDVGESGAGAAEAGLAGAAEAIAGVNEHLATGGADCTYCPVCRMISMVRGTSPEVREHLTSAATSLVHAAAGVLATPVPESPGGRDEPPLEHIDVSEGDEWEDD